MISKDMFARLVICVLAALGQVFAAPVITDFSPTAGAPGDQVILTGSGFSPGGFTVAFWNGGSGAIVTNGRIDSDTQLTVIVPSGITTGPISIQLGTGMPAYTVNDFLAIGPGPYITDFSPLFGSVNDTVVINGVHFANTTAVLFNGTNAPGPNPNAAGTQITTRVPPNATSGVITVSTINGTSNSPASFTVVGPGPFITDFSPISGGAGTTVQIDGLHFTGVTNVTFNGQPGVIVAANSDTLVQVQAPSGVSSGPIAVFTPLGSAITSSNFFGQPVITGFSPAYGRANTNVSIVGSNLLGATAVYFNGMVSPNFTVLNNTNLIASVPAGAASGLIRVIVPAGSGFSTTNFVVQPTISGFSPAFGPVGSSITITGANLNGSAPIVNFNGIQAAPPTGVSFGQLTALVPAGASTGPISVTTGDGSDTNASLFYLPASITGFSPTNSGPGSRITITGQNFVGASAIRFNGTAAAGFTVTNNVAVGATVPGNLITGPLSMTTPAGLVQSSGLFYGAPVITNFTPTHGLPGDKVTIGGVNFLGGTARFNGLSAAIVSLNNTQLVATVPSGAQTGPITVAGPAGTNTSSANFALDYTSDLVVGMTNSPNPATVGGNLVFTISIFNNGPSPAPNATFTNILPPTVTLNSVTITGPWVLTTNGNILSGSAGSLGVGTSTALIITVTPQATGIITNTISVASGNPDPTPGDNTATVTTTVEPAALLSIRLLPDYVRITWPSALSNYLLEFQDGLTAAPNWSPATSTPSVSGDLEYVTETNNGASRFYRLHK
jgi:uncharacterized repeat protein (TIGR01451 family)